MFGKQDFPSSDATQIANNLSNLGQIYNREDISTDVQVSSSTKLGFIVDALDWNGTHYYKSYGTRQGAKFWEKMEFVCTA